MTAMPGSILDRAVQREGLKGHDGRSGAVLERVVLDDGTRLVVKTAAPGTDLPGAATGDPGRELWLWSTGILGRLPPGAGHAIVDGWETGDGTIITVMRDLGDAVVGRRGPITRSRCRRILGAAAAVHRRFAGQHVARLCPLERRLTLFSPRGIAAAGGDNQLAALVARGWEYFAEIAPPDIVAEVFAVFDDPEPLANELRRGGSTLIHGDLWLVNVALPPRGVVLLDWGLATEAQPRSNSRRSLPATRPVSTPPVSRSSTTSATSAAAFTTSPPCGSPCSPGLSSSAGTKPSISRRTRRSPNASEPTSRGGLPRLAWRSTPQA